MLLEQKKWVFLGSPNLRAYRRLQTKHRTSMRLIVEHAISGEIVYDGRFLTGGKRRVSAQGEEW